MLYKDNFIMYNKGRNKRSILYKLYKILVVFIIIFVYLLSLHSTYSIIYLQGILNINSINQTFYRSISFPVQSGNTIFYLNITNFGNATINNITLSFSVIGNSVILSYNNLPITTLNNITISSPLQPNNSLIIPFNMLVISPGLTDVYIKVYVNGQYMEYGNYQFNVELGSSSPSLVVSENINYILVSLAGILGLLLLI